MSVKDDKRYIVSQGLPHFAAQYPKSYGIQKKNYAFRMSAKPQKNKTITAWRPGVFFGVALDGVPLVNSINTLWNNNPEWIKLSLPQNLDSHGGQVKDEGGYIYAAPPKDLISKAFTHVGYAADGFPIFVSKAGKFKSSYRLRDGMRPSSPQGPGGKYSGTYLTDYEYVPRSGHLDQCNGITIKDKYYIYVLTNEFPRIPLCWRGQPDRSFMTKIDTSSPAKPQANTAEQSNLSRKDALILKRRTQRR